jgi:hypothetical protein
MNTVGCVDLPTVEECRGAATVIELAHSCGWMHGDGMNVPADTGTLKCD